MSLFSVPSVNFHLWQACNMRCKFCFATFQDVKSTILPKGHLPKEQALKVVEHLADYGFEKITFAGGEPTLCPWLSDLIKLAKEKGLTTMIVTNGSGLNNKFLEENKQNLDWIALSIDSLNAETNTLLGRKEIRKDAPDERYYNNLIARINDYGYALKINTVANSLNIDEDFSEFIARHQPKRWKVLQVLPVYGQNDKTIGNLEISEQSFNSFKEKHPEISVTTVFESNNSITGSYAMVDPAGRFFDDTKGKHTYSEPILNVGVKKALSQVEIDTVKFEERGGNYNWEIGKNRNITLSGQVASGKSTVGKMLANKLGFEFVSLGNEIREQAKEKGISIVEFQNKCASDKSIDLQIDQEFSQKCNSRTNLIIDYRLGFRFIKESFHVYLAISEKEAIKRLKTANRDNETHITVRQRNESFRAQFLNSYGIDYTNMGHYNLVVNVEAFRSAEAIADYIISKLN